MLKLFCCEDRWQSMVSDDAQHRNLFIAILRRVNPDVSPKLSVVQGAGGREVGEVGLTLRSAGFHCSLAEICRLSEPDMLRNLTCISTA